jgi:hypothetical protein
LPPRFFPLFSPFFPIYVLIGAPIYEATKSEKLKRASNEKAKKSAHLVGTIETEMENEKSFWPLEFQLKSFFEEILV